MVSKKAPIQQVERLLDLVPYINSHQGIPLEDLAKKFDVSVTQLLEDLNTLWMCGDSPFDLMDLEFESGYVSIRNAQTLNRIRQFSEVERIALLFGLKILAEEFDERTEIAAKIEALQSKISPSFQQRVLATADVDTELFNAISRAIRKRIKMVITYLAINTDTISPRTIHPYDLIDNGKYLIAFCEHAGEQRRFSVDRIQSHNILSETFTPMTQTVLPSAGIPVHGVVHSKMRSVKERFTAGFDRDDATADFVVYNQDWLLRAVVSLAGSLEVQGSADTRTAIRSAAQRAKELYVR